MPQSRTVTLTIGCPPREVYDYVANPENLPTWAAGLGQSVSQVDGKWVLQSSSGPIGIRFVDRNELGVLDHHVTLASGEEILVPMRVVANGKGTEIMVTLFRQTGVENFAEDVGLVERDLRTLRRTLEGKGTDA